MHRSALVRVAPLSQGRITIDTVDIATLPLDVLRSRIALVPQEPFIFAGTIRENIDPKGLHLDSSIWNVINQCLATPLVQNLGGLNGELTSGGSNLSVGQKQLLCLARALLKNSKVGRIGVEVVIIATSIYLPDRMHRRRNSEFGQRI